MFVRSIVKLVPRTIYNVVCDITAWYYDSAYDFGYLLLSSCMTLGKSFTCCTSFSHLENGETTDLLPRVL